MYFTSTRSKASQGQKPVDLSVTPGPRIQTSKKFRYSTQKNYLWYVRRPVQIQNCAIFSFCSQLF